MGGARAGHIATAYPKVSRACVPSHSPICGFQGRSVMSRPVACSLQLRAVKSDSDVTDKRVYWEIITRRVGSVNRGKEQKLPLGVIDDINTHNGTWVPGSIPGWRTRRSWGNSQLAGLIMAVRLSPEPARFSHTKVWTLQTLGSPRPKPINRASSASEHE